jgi:hypothetical protein
MSEFNSVEAILTDVRTFLLDRRRPYRYSDEELLTALNAALLEARRIRADLFVTRYGNRVPSYHAVTSEPFCIEPQFRMAFVYGTTAHALARDDEDVQDMRANTFLAKFQAGLIGLMIPGVQGGTPGPKGQAN